MNAEPFNKKSAKLLQLARREFGESWQPRTEAEHNLLAAVTTKTPAYCGPLESDDEEDSNPKYASKWSDQRSIGSDLIRWLCSDPEARKLVDARGIQIDGARITGGLDLQDLVIPFPCSLNNCSIPGEVKLYSLEIPALRLGGSWTGPLSAGGIRVKGDIFLKHGFRADGEVDLIGAQIGGNLECTGGKFINPPQKGNPSAGIALNVEQVNIQGCLFLFEEFYAEGQVRLLGTGIGGDLRCAGEFVNPPLEGVAGSGIALFADGIVIKGATFLRACFVGEVKLLDAQIGGTLECDKGQFINSSLNGLPNSGNALRLDRATIAADVFLTPDLVEGDISLLGARIGGDLYCTRGDFRSSDVWFEGASAKSIRDQGSHWKKGGLHLNGFVYGLADPSDVKTRLQWIERQPEETFYFQPYLQLAKVLASAGDEEGRITVLVAMKDREWETKRRMFMAPVWRLPLKITIGYGYRPLMALWEILGLSALGWIVYRRSYLAGGVVPSDKDAYQEFKSTSQPPDYHKRFSPLIYSLENSLPLVTLGQAEKWQPDPSRATRPEGTAVKPTLGLPARWPRWVHWLQRFLVFVGLRAPEQADSPRSRASRWGTSSRFVRWFLWAQILLGWLLATLFLAGISGIIKKE